MQFDIKQYLTKRNVTIGGISMLAIGVLIASYFVPGLYYKGALPYNVTQQTIQTTPQVSPQMASQLVLTASCSANPSPAKVGETVTWTVNAIGGEGNYSYLWKGGGILPGSTTKSVNVTSYPIGTQSVSVDVTSGSSKVTANCSVNVESGISIIDIKKVDPYVDALNVPIVTCATPKTKVVLGENIQFNSNLSNGTADTYLWYFAKNNGGFTADSSRINQNTFYPTGSDSSLYNITARVKVKLISGTELFATCPTITISEEPNLIEFEGVYKPGPGTFNQVFAASCDVSPNPAEVGNDVTWTSKVSGGTTPYSYDWDDSEGFIVTQTGSSATAKVTKAGTDSAMVIVKDSANHSVNAKCPDLVINQSGFSSQFNFPPGSYYQKLSATCEVTPTTAKLGDSVTWKAVPKGGSISTYTYKWTDDWGVITSNGFINHGTQIKTLSQTGINKAYVEVKSGSDTVIAQCQDVTVNDPPQTIKPVTVSCKANPSNAYIDDSIIWSANVDGIIESAITGYQWNGSVAGASKDLSVKYSTVGTKSATVEISYGGKKAVSAPCTVTIFQKQQTPEADNQDLEQDETSPDTKTENEDSTAATSTTSATSQQAYVPVESKCPGVYYPKDIAGHWAEPIIKDAYDKCWVRGYSDNTYRPNSSITRAEATKIVMVGAALTPNSGCYDADCGSPFLDLDMWQGPWIRPAYDKGVVEGYSKTQFSPNRSITRAEASALVTRGFGLSAFVGCYTANCGAGHPNNFFLDIYDYWQGPYIRTLWDIGVINGAAPNRFEPNRPITRAELLKMVTVTASS